MSETAVKEPEIQPTESQVSQVAPPTGTDNRSVEELLEQFDLETKQQQEAEPQQTPEADNVAPNVSNDELDKFIAELSGPSADQQKITDLEGQISGLRAAEVQRQSRADFDKYSSNLQKECGPHVANDFAITELKAAVVDKPDLEIAWQYRHVTNDQLRAADLEFKQLEVLHRQVQALPNDDPRKQQALLQIEQRGLQLGYMLNARSLLNNARRAVLAKARKAPPEVDWEATADRNMVAASIRDGGSGRAPPPEPAPRLGNMDTNEYRRHVQARYGFDPI